MHKNVVTHSQTQLMRKVRLRHANDVYDARERSKARRPLVMTDLSNIDEPGLSERQRLATPRPWLISFSLARDRTYDLLPSGDCFRCSADRSWAIPVWWTVISYMGNPDATDSEMIKDLWPHRIIQPDWLSSDGPFWPMATRSSR